MGSKSQGFAVIHPSTEPTIVVNGQTLTTAQAMAVRVAINHMLIDLQGGDVLGDDDAGRRHAAAYKGRLTEVALAMLSAPA